jgi:hypothetical protein
MRPALLAATLAVALTSAGFAALAPGDGVPQFPATPARTHQTLGPVSVLTHAGPEAEANPLAEAARARYGRIDGLARVRTEALPGADCALTTGVAIRWH